MDPAFIGLSFNAPIYFVASDQIFNLGFVMGENMFLILFQKQSLFRCWNHKKMKKIIVEGGNVAILPEGNLTYTGSTAPLAPSIAKISQIF